jgi:hypothetical protein
MADAFGRPLITPGYPNCDCSLVAFFQLPFDPRVGNQLLKRDDRHRKVLRLLPRRSNLIPCFTEDFLLCFS